MVNFMKEYIDSFSLNLIDILLKIWPVKSKVSGQHQLDKTLTVDYGSDENGLSKQVTLVLKSEHQEITKQSKYISAIKFKETEIRGRISVIQCLVKNKNGFQCYKNYDPKELKGFDRCTHEHEFKQVFKELTEHMELCRQTAGISLR